MVRKGEITSDKQFLLFSQCFQQHIYSVCQNAALCGNRLKMQMTRLPKSKMKISFNQSMESAGMEFVKGANILTLSQTTNFRHFQIQRVSRQQFQMR